MTDASGGLDELLPKLSIFGFTRINCMFKKLKLTPEFSRALLAMKSFQESSCGIEKAGPYSHNDGNSEASSYQIDDPESDANAVELFSEEGHHIRCFFRKFKKVKNFKVLTMEVLACKKEHIDQLESKCCKRPDTCEVPHKTVLI